MPTIPLRLRPGRQSILVRACFTVYHHVCILILLPFYHAEAIRKELRRVMCSSALALPPPTVLVSAPVDVSLGGTVAEGDDAAGLSPSPTVSPHQPVSASPTVTTSYSPVLEASSDAVTAQVQAAFDKTFPGDRIKVLHLSGPVVTHVQSLWSV